MIDDEKIIEMFFGRSEQGIRRKNQKKISKQMMILWGLRFISTAITLSLSLRENTGYMNTIITQTLTETQTDMPHAQTSHTSDEKVSEQNLLAK